VRAHLVGGVPVSEVEAKRRLFEALGFDPAQVFTKREKDPAYFDFEAKFVEKAKIRALIESDVGVHTRTKALGDALDAWWRQHANRLADLPRRRDLNAVRSECLDSFVAALSPMNTLDRFKLAGVIAIWWTETLPDFKTLLENDFAGVIDGWVDAIADAVEDDDNSGPAFDPFTHRLVLRMMSDYLDQIAAAKAEVARLKGEKEAFEQSNAPDDLDEEELTGWNYVKDLERQAKELRGENRDALRALAKLEKSAAKAHATETHRRALDTARGALRPVLEQLSVIETALAPYEKIKADLSAARTQYRKLTEAFVDVLRQRCGAMSDDQRQALVLELLAQDVHAGMDAAVAEKRQELVRFVEGLWEKYRVPFKDIRHERTVSEERLDQVLTALNYVH